MTKGQAAFIAGFGAFAAVMLFVMGYDLGQNAVAKNCRELGVFIYMDRAHDCSLRPLSREGELSGEQK